MSQLTAKENLERAAYTAIGAPVAGAKALRERAEKLAESVRETRSELRSDALRGFDHWVAEGEVVVDRLLDWLRSTGATEELRSARKTAAKQVRSGMGEVTGRLDKVLDAIEPEIDLREIRGIGPANAQRLENAGVAGVAGFLAHTGSDDAIGLLADETGISVDTLAQWRLHADLTRVDGIGDAYQRMLHAVGIGTLTHLANADPESTFEALSRVDRPGMPRQRPGKSEVSDWVAEAGRLSIE